MEGDDGNLEVFRSLGVELEKVLKGVGLSEEESKKQIKNIRQEQHVD